MRNKVKKPVILCDLGGVLINLNWLKCARSIFGLQLSVEELKARWMSSKSAFLYETGAISFDEFYRQFTSEISADMTRESFEAAFDGIIGELKPDCIKILNELAKISELVLLSNSNDRHIGMLKKRTGVFEPFTRLFFSHEMHLVKPDKQIFAEVCNKIHRKPDEIYFFDDTKINVETAKELGFNAVLTESPKQIYKFIQETLPVFKKGEQQ